MILFIYLHIYIHPFKKIIINIILLFRTAFYIIYSTCLWFLSQPSPMMLYYQITQPPNDDISITSITSTSASTVKPVITRIVELPSLLVTESPMILDGET